MGQIYSRLLKKSPPIFTIQSISSTPPIRHTQNLPPFPLFRLPQVAYKNVIDLMNFSEQVNISLCSRRTNSIIKYIRNRPKTLEVFIFKDQINISTGFYIALNGLRIFITVLSAKKMSSDIDISETVLIRGHRVPAKLISLNGDQYLETYWEDEDFGVRMIGDYVCDLFRVDIFCIQIKKDYRRMIDWVNNRQPSIDVLRLKADSDNISGNDVKYILSNCNAKQLISDGIKLQNFRINKISKRFEFLALRECDWITMDNIMTMEATQIIATNSKFTKNEVNRFLKHWLNGGSPRLEIFKVGVEENFELFDFLDGLMDHFVEGAPGKRTFLSKSSYEYDFLEFGIRRNDGTVASMIAVEKTFRLGVWPDEMGRTFDSVF